ncbi:uncharacterized protein CANTADRAFT_50492 [Suhomyces tanzawaensis NRRL Y-17324]|uniref:Uncharacterized protein n=1 Tax=Suhomyces tanzawaensis NRRL Y-17324 TaxID=984487 RepID=A0A1E4SLB3_9ASCO|nr:uncharacterized protein CANTADRAFT_50492 [Suhomyces tanzawaensis NRRL Y-17324]ODV80293.1 hypothetical protein CANTADRAFT_50492 [Suhomyces tanzawaensis NRRL Y-17324]
MKFTLSTIALLASAVSAAVTDIDLYIDSQNKEVDGNSLQPLHEGAAIQYLFLGHQQNAFQYDSDTQVLSGPNPPQTPFANNFSIVDHVAWTSSSTEATKVTIIGGHSADRGFLAINGSSDGFYAVKNINDPYQYSNQQYALVYYPDGGQPDGAISVNIRTHTSDNSTSNDSSASASPSAAASSAPKVTPANGAGANAVSGAVLGGAALLAMLI